MTISEMIPGMKPGATLRNIAFGVVYLFFFPVILPLLPFLVGFFVYRNYGGWATKLSAIPGITTNGGVQSGAVATIYILLVFAVLGAGAGGSDEVNGSNGSDLEDNGDGEEQAEAADEAETDEMDHADESDSSSEGIEADDTDDPAEDESTAEDQTEESTASPAEGEEVELRVAVWDETENNPPGERAEVWIEGTGSWYPDLEFGGETLEDAGPFERYSEGEIYIYPDGRDNGAEILATVGFDEEFISSSPRDAVRIEIYDERVIVVGTPVEAQHGEYEIEFDR